MSAVVSAPKPVDPALVSAIADRMAFFLGCEEASLKEMREHRAAGDEEWAGICGRSVARYREAYDHYAFGRLGEEAEAELERRGLL